jgi:biopolymer transport protein ExbB
MQGKRSLYLPITLAFSALALTPFQAMAQSASPQESEAAIKIINLFQRGGPIMYPLLACSIIALAIVLERLFNLRKLKIIPPDFLHSIRQHWQRGETEMAVNVCEGYNVPISRVLRAGLMRSQEGFSEMEKAIEGAGAHETSLLSANLRILGAVGNLAPMLGLLGTVIGMIKAFDVISQYGTGDPGLVASGISEALITTAAGLVIGIPSLAFYHFLRGRVEKFIYEMEDVSIELMEKFQPDRKTEKDGGDRS